MRNDLLPHTLDLPVLGVEIEFRSNSLRVLEIVDREYGRWRTLAVQDGIVSRSEAIVEIVVDGSETALPRYVDLDYRLPLSNRMEIAGPGASGVADTGTLRSIVRVDTAYLDRPDTLAREIVEPVTLFLLGHLDRVPLHAGAVRRGNVGVVLVGPSGAGKSTLVFAAARAGYTPIADDPVYVQAEPSLRVWGRRPEVHLRPEARTHFPELAGVVPTRMSGGKAKLVIAMRPGPPFVDRVGLCLLRRGNAVEPLLTRISAGEAREEVIATLAPGFDLFRDVVGERVERMAERGAWALEVGRTPQGAVVRIDEIAAALEEGD